MDDVVKVGGNGQDAQDNGAHGDVRTHGLEGRGKQFCPSHVAQAVLIPGAAGLTGPDAEPIEAGLGYQRGLAHIGLLCPEGLDLV